MQEPETIADAQVQPVTAEKSNKKNSKLNLKCRMYENVYPEQETCVMVNVRQVTDVGTYVTLLEYNDIEGTLIMTRNDFIE